MKVRISLLFMLCLLLPTGHIAAQEFYCSTLSRTDCALFERSDQTAPQSAAFDMSIITEVDFGFESLEFIIDMDGSYQADPAGGPALDALIDDEELADMSLELVEEVLVVALDSFDADLNISLSLPRRLSRGVFEAPLEVSLWYVDSIGYIDLNNLGEALDDPTLSGLYGFDIANAASFGLSFIEDATWQEVRDEILATPDATTALLPIEDQLVINDAVTIVREQDTADGTVFTTTINILPLLELEALREQFYQGQTTTELSRAEIDAFSDALVASLETDGLVISETLDPATARTTAVDLSLVSEFDTSTFANAYGAATGDYATFGTGLGIVDLVFTITIDRTAFGTVKDILPPPDADIISLFQMFTLLGEGA